METALINTELDIFLQENEGLVRDLLKIKKQKERLDKKDKNIREAWMR